MDGLDDGLGSEQYLVFLGVVLVLTIAALIYAIIDLSVSAIVSLCLPLLFYVCQSIQPRS
jgi:hypothetical protein